MASESQGVSMKILHVCSEFYPLLKTGGLADVTGALPKYQNQLGAESRVLLPAFPAMKRAIPNLHRVAQIETFAGTATLLYGLFNEIGIYLIDVPSLYDREGNPYHDSHLNSYADNHLRFGLLGFMAAELALGLDFFWQPQIVHCHDWHAGLTAAYLKQKDPAHSIKTVFTIHNLAYHGSFEAYRFYELWLPQEFFSINGLEFYGQISFLKAGLYYSDHITVVSPTYASEILSPENAHGFAGILNKRAQAGQLTGILNGIDEDIWNPSKDVWIKANYNKRNLRQKRINKVELQRISNLPVDPDCILFAVASRLAYQKGLDLVIESLPHLLSHNVQFVLLGEGSEELKQGFIHQSQNPAHQSKMSLDFVFDEELSHQIMAAADIIMMPSRFEPCGLSQLYGLKYGTLPLVHSTGGLADTVVDTSTETINDKSATGFVFFDFTSEALNATIDRVLLYWKNQKIWRKLQQQAMSQNYFWIESAKKYLQLYSSL